MNTRAFESEQAAWSPGRGLVGEDFTVVPASRAAAVRRMVAAVAAGDLEAASAIATLYGLDVLGLS